jgi:GTP cyclohydrolase II
VKAHQRDAVIALADHQRDMVGGISGAAKCNKLCIGAGWGVLLYLRQEGRGIGLVNKLRAYALQDQGFDTVDANIRLGFAVDARDFAVAAQMLRLLAVDHVRLLTNNPEKVAGLEAEGVIVTERLPLKIAANPHNAHYLETKRDRTGHKL